MVVLAQTGLEGSGSVVKFVVAVVFLLGVFPAVFVLGRLFDRFF